MRHWKHTIFASWHFSCSAGQETTFTSQKRKKVKLIIQETVVGAFIWLVQTKQECFWDSNALQQITWKQGKRSDRKALQMHHIFVLHNRVWPHIWCKTLVLRTPLRFEHATTVVLNVRFYATARTKLEAIAVFASGMNDLCRHSRQGLGNDLILHTGIH